MLSKLTRIRANFYSGFSLLNHNIDLYIIALLFLLIDFTARQIDYRPLTFMMLPIYVVSFSYDLSIPYFLRRRQLGKVTDFALLKKILWQNSWRLVLPIIISSVAATIILMFFYLNQIKGPVTSNLWFLFAGTQIASSLVRAAVIFSPIYFSIEKQGIVRSIIKSAIFSLRNYPFFLTVFAVELLLGTASMAVKYFSRFGLEPSTLLASVIFTYVNIWLLTSALLYFQQKTGSTKSGLDTIR